MQSYLPSECVPLRVHGTRRGHTHTTYYSAVHPGPPYPPPSTATGHVVTSSSRKEEEGRVGSGT